MPTRQDALDRANANDLPAQLRALNDPSATVENSTSDGGTAGSLGFGAMLAAMRPRNRARTGLTSQVAHVHDIAAVIYNVEDVAGTNLSMISGAAPGAGECRVEYDAATGVPTLTFNGALTAYIVMESGPLPQTLAANISANL